VHKGRHRLIMVKGPPLPLWCASDTNANPHFILHMQVAGIRQIVGLTLNMVLFRMKRVLDKDFSIILDITRMAASVLRIYLPHALFPYHQLCVLCKCRSKYFYTADPVRFDFVLPISGHCRRAQLRIGVVSHVCFPNEPL